MRAMTSARGTNLGDFLNLSLMDNGFGYFLAGPGAKAAALAAFVLLILIMCRFTIWHKEKKHAE